MDEYEQLFLNCIFLSPFVNTVSAHSSLKVCYSHLSDALVLEIVQPHTELFLKILSSVSNAIP